MILKDTARHSNCPPVALMVSHHSSSPLKNPLEAHRYAGRSMSCRGIERGRPGSTMTPDALHNHDSLSRSQQVTSRNPAREHAIVLLTERSLSRIYVSHDPQKHLLAWFHVLQTCEELMNNYSSSTSNSHDIIHAKTMRFSAGSQADQRKPRK